jgi:hypothetical protein
MDVLVEAFYSRVLLDDSVFISKERRHSVPFGNVGNVGIAVWQFCLLILFGNSVW